MSWEVLIILALVFLIGGLFQFKTEQKMKVEGIILITFAIIFIISSFVLYFVGIENNFLPGASIFLATAYLLFSKLTQWGYC